MSWTEYQFRPMRLPCQALLLSFIFSTFWTKMKQVLSTNQYGLNPFCRGICCDCYFLRRYLWPEKDVMQTVSRRVFLLRLRGTLRTVIYASQAAGESVVLGEKILFYPTGFSLPSLKQINFPMRSLLCKTCGFKCPRFFHISTTSPPYFNW